MTVTNGPRPSGPLGTNRSPRGEASASNRICALGSIICGQGAVTPTFELCNNLDDDCDGTVDSATADPDGDGYVECDSWDDVQGDDGAVIGGFDRAMSAITRIRLFGSFSAISVICSPQEEVYY